MNKIWLSALFIISVSLETNAQQIKIGVFDADIMVQVLPGYRSSVDSLLEVFASDSLARNTLSTNRNTLDWIAVTRLIPQ